MEVLSVLRAVAIELGLVAGIVVVLLVVTSSDAMGFS